MKYLFRKFFITPFCTVVFSVLILVSVFVNTAFCVYNDKTAFETANDFLNAGQYLEAIGMYQEISNFSSNPDIKAKALFFSGRTYSLYLDNYNAALAQFDRIMKDFPQSPFAPEALFSSGMVLYETGHYQKAHSFFQTYINYYPSGKHRQSAEVWADSAKSFIAGNKPIKQQTPGDLAISDTVIRVLVKKRTDKVSINTKGKITVSDSFSDKLICSGSGALLVAKQGEYLTINGQKVNATTIRVATDGITMNLEGTDYRDVLTVSAGSEGLSVINHVHLEHYLYGVVPKEMPHSWPEQALMAQAIAARTYALYIKSKSCTKPYDVEATVSSQVYGGYAAEKLSTNNAVNATRGLVMTYNGKLIIAYFHSNSGGYTENPKNVWGAEVPYLKSIPDKFSLDTKNAAWEYFLSYDDAQTLMKRYGIIAGSITRLNPSGVSKSGRILNIAVVGDSESAELSSNNFRIKVGASRLKSTLCSFIPDARGILFKGKGYGHGVGMSQWGARAMAQTGRGYQDILKFYYQDIMIVKL